MAQQVPSLAGERPRVMGVAKNKQTNKQARDEEAAFPVFCSCTFMVSVLSLIFKPFFLGQAKGLQKLWGQGASPSPAGPPGRSPWLSPEPILSGFCVWGASGARAVLCVDVSCPHHHLFMEGLSCPSRVFWHPVKD